MGRKGKAMAPRQTQLHLGSSWRLDAALILGKEGSSSSSQAQTGSSATSTPTPASSSASSTTGRASSATNCAEDDACSMQSSIASSASAMARASKRKLPFEPVVHISLRLVAGASAIVADLSVKRKALKVDKLKATRHRYGKADKEAILKAASTLFI